MSLLTEYFAAASDSAAAAVVAAGPSAAAITDYSIEPASNLPSVEELLTGTAFDELMDRDAYPVVSEAEGMPFVLRVNDDLVVALLASDDDRLRDIGRRWALNDEMAGADPDLLGRFLLELRRLGAMAREQGQQLYCWVS